MRSAGDISLPLHVTNETAHHKVRGLSWVTVSWFFLRDISVEFFPEVFLVALSTTSSVPSSSSVFQKRADISTIDILKTSPKQPRWMAEEFDEEFRWRFICFHGSHFVPHFNPCQCLHLAHTFLKTSNRRMRFTVISSNFQDFGWPRLSVQRLERHRFSILARASNHHSGSIHQWLALTIFLPPPPSQLSLSWTPSGTFPATDISTSLSAKTSTSCTHTFSLEEKNKVASPLDAELQFSTFFQHFHVFWL